MASDLKTIEEMFAEEISGVALFPETLPQDSTIDHFVMRKNMHESQKIVEEIYDTESYYKEEKTPTDLFEISSGDEVHIEILKHIYTKEMYEYTQYSEELPSYNMPWRNAISFLGRIVKNMEVVYRGVITIQYDGEKHYIVIVKPWQVNYATFSQEDPLSLSYNALDDTPFIFQDLTGEDADAFMYPTVLGVIPYNIQFGIPNPGKSARHAKVFSSFDKYQMMFLRPYFAIPKMPQIGGISEDGPDLFRLRLNVRLHSEDEGEDYILSDSVTKDGHVYIDWSSPDLQQFLFKVWDLTESHNEVIRVDLITEAIHSEKFESTNENNVPIDPQAMVQNIDEILNNMAGKEEPLEYTIEVSTRTHTLSEADKFYEYHSTIKITRIENVYDLYDGSIVEKKEHKKEMTHVFRSNDLDASIQKKVRFEGINFLLNLGMKAADVYDVKNYTETVKVSAEERVRHVSTGTTQPIMLRGERLIDPNEMFEKHDLWKATKLANLDRYGLLYGEHTGSNVLQFTEYDLSSHAPFPYGAIDFADGIVHVHNHRNTLYVFTKSGLYILHDGFGPMDMTKTFAYANVNLHPSEKNTVVSFGNEVFYINNGVGYAIRTNVNVESEDDVYVQPVTQPIGDLLKNPARHIKLRLEEGYGEKVDTHDNLTVSYYTKATNNELYIFATYYANAKSIMVVYIFDRDHKRWKMYDTIAGGQPIEDVTSGHSKGFDLVLKNNYLYPYTTYASFLQVLPENAADLYISDVEAVKKYEEGIFYVYPEKNYPIGILLDTGALSFDSMHSKKVRRIMLKLLDLKGDNFDMYVVPHMDYNDYQNRLHVEVSEDENLEYQAQYIGNQNTFEYSPSIPMITPQNIKQEGFRITNAKGQGTKKLNLLTQLNIKGKLPGFRLYIFTHNQLKIGDYGIVYRQQKAR